MTSASSPSPSSSSSSSSFSSSSRGCVLLVGDDVRRRVAIPAVLVPIVDVVLVPIVAVPSRPLHAAPTAAPDVSSGGVGFSSWSVTAAHLLKRHFAILEFALLQQEIATSHDDGRLSSSGSIDNPAAPEAPLRWLQLLSLGPLPSTRLARGSGQSPWLAPERDGLPSCTWAAFMRQLHLHLGGARKSYTVLQKTQKIKKPKKNQKNSWQLGTFCTRCTFFFFPC